MDDRYESVGMIALTGGVQVPPPTHWKPQFDGDRVGDGPGGSGLLETLSEIGPRTESGLTEALLCTNRNW